MTLRLKLAWPMIGVVKFFSFKEGESLTICADSDLPLPRWIAPILNQYLLTYTVRAFPSSFDDSLVIFEFSAAKYPKLKRHSYNPAPPKGLNHF